MLKDRLYPESVRRLRGWGIARETKNSIQTINYGSVKIMSPIGNRCLNLFRNSFDSMKLACISNVKKQKFKLVNSIFIRQLKIYISFFEFFFKYSIQETKKSNFFYLFQTMQISWIFSIFSL